MSTKNIVTEQAARPTAEIFITRHAKAPQIYLCSHCDSRTVTKSKALCPVCIEMLAERMMHRERRLSQRLARLARRSARSVAGSVWIRIGLTAAAGSAAIAALYFALKDMR